MVGVVAMTGAGASTDTAAAAGGSGPVDGGVKKRSPSKRRTSSRKNRTGYNRRVVSKKPSSAMYVGYVEEFETIDMIMKKFEALDEAKAKAAAAKQAAQDKKRTDEEENMDTSNADATQKEAEEPKEEIVKKASKGKGKAPMTIEDVHAQEEEEMLTEAQLEALFKQTSFTSMGNLLHEDRNTVLDTANEFVNSDDELEYFYDSEDEDFARPRKGRKERAPREKVERRERVRIVTCQVRDQFGRMVVYKRKVKCVDPNLPVYTRVPPEPVPLSWALPIQPYAPPKYASLKDKKKEYVETDKILDFDLTSIGETFDAILFDPPWHTTDTVIEDGKPSNYYTPQDFAKLNITDKLITHGFAFVWTEKEHISQILKIFRKWGFEYIENFSVLQKNVDNKFIRRPYQFLNKSKLTLLMLRKGTQSMELRHQRNPDIHYNFIRHHRNHTELSHKTDFVYKIMETLLPDANYKDDAGRGRFLHLWAPHGDHRQGWTKVVDTKTSSAIGVPEVTF